MSKSKGGKAPVREKNEYIPRYISRKPFYIDDDAEGDYLEHQRLQQKQPTDLSESQWYDRGKRVGPAATKYRKGACENCGAITHKTKECLSRPRKLGAKWTGEDIQADEVIQEVELGWDAKRDRWNGYDAREHGLVVEEFNRMEDLRKKEKEAKERESRSKSRDLADGEAEGEDDEDKYAESANAPGQTFDAANRISTRNLRIREDTAKYLLNLDLNSAKYDPKTRTMVNTNDADGPSDAASLALLEEESFMRSSGDAAEFERMQKYAWETREKGGGGPKIHLQANPTQGELYRKAEMARIAKAKEEERKRLLDKYGGAEYLEKKEGLLPVTEESEVYVEYTPSGELKLPPGVTKPRPKSKYVEDKYIGNHTTVWGSWWKSFQWGYACCHSTIKNSYCTGEEGKKAALESANLLQERLDAHGERKEAVEEEKQREVTPPPPVKQNEHDPEKAKRKLDAMLGGVTEEEMEDYRRQKKMAEDPMANFLSAPC